MAVAVRGVGPPRTSRGLGPAAPTPRGYEPKHRFKSSSPASAEFGARSSPSESPSFRFSTPEGSLLRHRSAIASIKRAYCGLTQRLNCASIVIATSSRPLRKAIGGPNRASKGVKRDRHAVTPRIRTGINERDENIEQRGDVIKAAVLPSRSSQGRSSIWARSEFSLTHRAVQKGLLIAAAGGAITR